MTDLATELEDLRRRLSAVERASQLAHSSIENDEGATVNLSAQVESTAAAVATALDATVALDEKLDDKATTFYQEAEPDVETEDVTFGDLWVKPSTGETRTHNGDEWTPLTTPSPVPDPPSSSPAPDVRAGIGSLFVLWDALTDSGPYPVTYDVHVDTATGFTSSPANLVGSGVGSGPVVVRSLANGARVVSGTTYFVKIVARNSGGPATESAEASGTPAQATTDEIAANTITADQLAANAVTAGKIQAEALDGMTITGATIRTAEDGKRWEIDSSNQNEIRGYSGVPGEIGPGSLIVDDFGSGTPTVTLRPPYLVAGDVSAAVELFHDASGHSQADLQANDSGITGVYSDSAASIWNQMKASVSADASGSHFGVGNVGAGSAVSLGLDSDAGFSVSVADGASGDSTLTVDTAGRMSADVDAGFAINNTTPVKGAHFGTANVALNNVAQASTVISFTSPTGAAPAAVIVTARGTSAYFATCLTKTATSATLSVRHHANTLGTVTLPVDYILIW